MPDIDRRQRAGEPSEDERDLEQGYVDEVPGHTPGVAEGDDEAVPRRAHGFPDPDKTPGCAEG